MTGLSTLPSIREQARHVLLLLGVPTAPRLLVDVHAALFDGDLSVPALVALVRDEERTFGRTDGAAPTHAEGPISGHVEGAISGRAEGAISGRAEGAISGRAEGAMSGRAEGAMSGREGAMSGRTEEALSDHAEGAMSGNPDGTFRAPDDGIATGGNLRPASRRDDVQGAGHERPGGTIRQPYLICPGLNLDLTPARGLVTLSTWSVAERICTPAVARAEALAIVVRVAEFVAVRPGTCGAWLLRQLAETVPGGPETVDPLKPLALAEVARAALTNRALVDAVAAEQPAREAAAARATQLDERTRLFGVPSVPHQRDGA